MAVAAVGALATIGTALVGAATAVAGFKIGAALLEETARLEAIGRRFETVFDEFVDVGGKARDSFAEIFGKPVAFEGMASFLDDLNESAGLGLADLKSLASGIQDILIPLGFNRQDASFITQQLTERAIALAQFTGIDTATAINAVTSALVGEREQLKSLGVVVSQSEVDDWIEKNAGNLKGLSDGEQSAVATLAIIEAKSTDAWDAYSDGLLTAQSTLNSLSATFADFKDNVVAGLGGVLTGIIDDLDSGATSGLTDALQGIPDWINANQNTVRSFFIDLGAVILSGADAALVFAQTIVQGLAGPGRSLISSSTSRLTLLPHLWRLPDSLLIRLTSPAFSSA